MEKLTIALILLLAPHVAAQRAGFVNFKHFKTAANSFLLLDDIALNATAADRTITLTLDRKYAKVVIGIDFEHNAATTVTATPTVSYDGSVFFSKTTKSCASGTCTVYQRTDSNPVSGDEEFELEFDVRGLEKLKIVFAGASAGASDTIDVQAVAVVGD